MYEEKLKLNLGCGQAQFTDAINVDKDDFGQEVIRDINRGLPFEDNRFESVYTAHFMEHIKSGEDLYFVLSEIYRVTKPGGKVWIIVPHTSCQEAFYPDHLSFWNESVMKVICNDADFSQRQEKYKYKFKILEMERIIYELRTTLEIIK